MTAEGRWEYRYATLPENTTRLARCAAAPGTAFINARSSRDSAVIRFGNSRPYAAPK
jgi:hypothetical protein